MGGAANSRRSASRLPFLRRAWEQKEGNGVDLYLIRHAEATPPGEGGVTEDADRPLTLKGEAEAKTVASGLHRKGITLSAIVTSPLLRAHQTADAILRNLPEPAPELKVCEELAFGGKRRKLNRFIKDL